MRLLAGPEKSKNAGKARCKEQSLAALNVFGSGRLSAFCLPPAFFLLRKLVDAQFAQAIVSLCLRGFFPSSIYRRFAASISRPRCFEWHAVISYSSCSDVVHIPPFMEFLKESDFFLWPFAVDRSLFALIVSLPAHRRRTLNEE